MPAPQIGQEPERSGKEAGEEYCAQQAGEPRHGGLSGIAHAVDKKVHFRVRLLGRRHQQGQRSGDEHEKLDQFDRAAQWQAHVPPDNCHGIRSRRAQQRGAAKQGDALAQHAHAVTAPSAAMEIGGSPAFTVMASI